MQRSTGRILRLSTTHRRAASLAKGALPLALAGALCACAVSSPFAISSTGTGMVRGTSIALPLPDDTRSQRGRFSFALSTALKDQSVSISDNAPLLADFSVTQGPAKAGVLRGEGTYVEGEEEQDWIAAPRRDRRFDKCDAQRLRATLALYNRQTGELVYRGSGEATECSFTDEDMSQLAEQLVQDALSRR